MISSLKEFVSLFDTKTEAAKKLGVSDAHLSMALKRNTPIIVEHKNKEPISAIIQTTKQWGNISGHFNT
jgi:hypothetical protein